MHYLYIIHSSALDKFYVGETEDMARRIEQHRTGYFERSYTSQAQDWEIRLVLEFGTVSQAKKAESFVKRMNSRKFIERLIEDSNWLVEKFKT